MSTSPPGSKGRLLQVLGLWFGIAAIIGNSIGIGIMRTPSEVARHLPTTTGYLVAWALGGLYAALGVASMAELGVLMPRSGGQYVFARQVFGPYAGFVVGWSDWVSSSAAGAAVSMAVAEYAGAFVSAETRVVLALALGIVAFVTALLWRGVRSSGLTVQLLTLAKVVVLVGVPLVAFATQAQAPREPLVAAGTGALTIGGVVLAMQAVIYSYDGWTGVLYFSGEVTDPARDIPRSMFGGVASVFAIYMLLVGCFVYVLGIGGVAANNFPAGQVANVVFGETGGTIIRIVVIITGITRAARDDRRRVVSTPCRCGQRRWDSDGHAGRERAPCHRVHSHRYVQPGDRDRRILLRVELRDLVFGAVCASLAGTRSSAPVSRLRLSGYDSDLLAGWRWIPHRRHRAGSAEQLHRDWNPGGQLSDLPGSEVAKDRVKRSTFSSTLHPMPGAERRSWR
jgi:hypothetical protein